MMKSIKLVVAAIIGSIVSGCSVLPLSSSIDEGHFRFQNFINDTSRNTEYIHLMCHQKRHVGGNQSKEYLGGEHNLWVKAVVAKTDIQNSRREAFINFEVDLEAGNTYMLNRKVDEKQISIWIQNAETGVVVSDVKVAKLELPKLVEKRLRREQCESGTI